MKTCNYIYLFTLFFVFALSYSVFGQKKGEEIKRQGTAYMQAEKYTEAIEQFNIFVSENPRIAEGYNLRGYCYEQKKQYQNAAADFRNAIMLAPSNQDYKKNLTRVSQTWQKELYKKIDFHKKEVEFNPNNPLNYLEVGKAYKALEIWDLGEKWYDDYFNREPNVPPEEIIKYTDILVRTGSIIKGEKLLKKYVDKYPGDYRLWSRYGYFAYWLSKYKIAGDAFAAALKIKPDCKEAENGLDLARSHGYLNEYQIPTNEKNSSVEMYYGVLADKPNDDSTRFLLVKELIKAERYDEAYQQLQYLQPNYQEDEKYKELDNVISNGKNSLSANKIEEFQTLLKAYPENREAVRKIAEYYSGLMQYADAENVLKNYLNLVPDDADIRFIYARVLTSGKKYDEAFPEIQKVLENGKPKLSYKLLAGRLGLLLEKDPDKTKKYIEDVLKEEPDNINALLAYSTINFREMNFESASSYAEKARIIDPENPELIKLIAMIETEKFQAEQEALWKRFAVGQKLAEEKKYNEAKPYFDEVIDRGSPPPEVLAEYADLLANLRNFRDAITIYDTLISKNYSLNFDRKRGKIILQSGDSLKAFTEFERIVKDNPDDVESKIYLGDSYAKLSRYEDARSIYKSVVEVAPEEFVVEERIDNLPPTPGTFASFMASFKTHCFSYLTILPAGYYFGDNIDFDYKYAGIGMETALNEFVSLSGSFLRGNFGNPRETAYFSVYKGTLNVKVSKKTSIGFGYGRMIIQETFTQPLIDAYIKYDDNNTINAALSYSMTDGAALFLSPDLVNNRVQAHSLKISASYNYEEKLKFSTYLHLMFSEKSNVYYANQTQSISNNIGNNFVIRLGKAFYPTLFVGYEYFYADYKYILPVYYTPQEFGSHSLWAEWQLANDFEWEVLAAGKIGYVPQSDYIVREGNLKVLYKMTNNFKLGLIGLIGDSVRDKTTYKSGSLNISAFWSL